ncbi:hypothetical protein DID77_03270 [Candidatus Marinamargulisbacteria bacterium SCGC AG-439-L15]|nr:hypothetical protein DID77_03270 [Candidatus Marinamargulisbacteria bacterium SCGC AG-439-L15]
MKGVEIMKKGLFCLLGLFFVAVTVQANPQFGITGASDGGAGLTAVGNQYSASILYSIINNRGGVDEDQSAIEFNAKYKIALDAKTKATVGARHLLIELKTTDDDDSDENSKTALTAGVEHRLSECLLVFAETDVYSVQTIDDGDEETSVFTSARVGVSVLF